MHCPIFIQIQPIYQKQISSSHCLLNWSVVGVNISSRGFLEAKKCRAPGKLVFHRFIHSRKMRRRGKNSLTLGHLSVSLSVVSIFFNYYKTSDWPQQKNRNLDNWPIRYSAKFTVHKRKDWAPSQYRARGSRVFATCTKRKRNVERQVEE